jgi:hypothetical protein
MHTRPDEITAPCEASASLHVPFTQIRKDVQPYYDQLPDTLSVRTRLSPYDIAYRRRDWLSVHGLFPKSRVR